MAAKPQVAAQETTTITIKPLVTGGGLVKILGNTPLIYNAMSEKAKQDTLLPGRPKTAAERQQTLRHDPLMEYRNSVYITNEEKAPTRLVIPAIMFKAAMMDAALEIPGATKTSIGRLLTVMNSEVAIYGVPVLKMDRVKQAGINHAPDIRTRASIKQWACELQLRWVKPQLTEEMVINLVAWAGMLIGIGDYRQGKGKGDYGQFSIASADNAAEMKEWNRIVQSGGYKAQDAALETPGMFDEQTDRLYTWYNGEIKRREKMPESAMTKKAAKAAQAAQENGLGE